MEYGGIIGLIILIADIWAIINVMGSGAQKSLTAPNSRQGQSALAKNLLAFRSGTH